jgi:hypothetical protein
MQTSNVTREYMASMLAELKLMAKREGLDYLAYVVAMAEEEARSHASTEAPTIQETSRKAGA